MGRTFRASIDIPPGRTARDDGTERELITLTPAGAIWCSQTSEPLGTGHVQAFALADRKALM
jgi:hypothetical protein